MYTVILFPIVFVLYEFYPVFVWYNPLEKDRKVIQDLKRIPRCIFNRGFSTHLTFIWIYIAASLLLFVLDEFAHPPSEATMASLLVLVIFTNCFYLYKKQNRRYLNWRYLVVAALTTVGGIIAYALDVKNFQCNPSSLFQGHAAWHILTALSLMFIYFYYRTEKALDEHEGLQYDPLNQEMNSMRASTQYGDELEDEDDAALDYDSDLEEEENNGRPATNNAATTTTTTTTTTSVAPSPPTSITTDQESPSNNPPTNEEEITE